MKESMSLEPIVSQQDVDKCVDCPLCMEALDYDDLGFFPCSCGYQVCRFCWHRLKNDETGLCPACRQTYPESPIQFSSISIEAVEELKKRKKKQKEKQKLKESAKTQNLSSVRVVQKNLLFVIGLPQRLTQEDLRKEFIKYGKILKMVINASSAYVTYSRPEDAVAAIKSLNDSVKQNGNRNGTAQQLRASLGTTKYCTHWLRCQTCPKQPDCMYLHEMAEPEASFTKEEMQLSKHTEYEKRLITHYLDLIIKEREKKKTETNDKLIDEKCNNSKKLLNDININRKYDTEPNGCSETSNDSLLNCESDTDRISSESRAEQTQSFSPLMPSRWGTTINRSNCSSNSESNSNSLSSTPNNTIITNQTIISQQNEINGQFINNIDDNAVDSGLISNSVIDEDSDDMNGDDDGLDFDPISISSRGLQDLLNDSDNDCHIINNSNEFIGQKFVTHRAESQSVNKPVNQYSNELDLNNWRTQQNCLRQLLPNVNITFQHQNQLLNQTSNGFNNGFNANPNTCNITGINNSQIRPEPPHQTIAPQMQSFGGQMIGHSMMNSNPNMIANTVNCVQYWNQTQQQQHILRLQQQQQLQRQQQLSQSLFMPTISSMSSRPPPPGF